MKMGWSISFWRGLGWVFNISPRLKRNFIYSYLLYLLFEMTFNKLIDEGRGYLGSNFATIQQHFVVSLASVVVLRFDEKWCMKYERA